MKSTHAVDDVATHPQPSRVVHYLYSLAQQVMSGFRSARRHLGNNDVWSVERQKVAGTREKEGMHVGNERLRAQERLAVRRRR